MSMDDFGPGQMSAGQPGQPEMQPAWQQPPQKKGMGTGCKVLIILGIVVGLFLVLCCGGFGLLGWHFSRAVSDDPAVVASVAQKIVQIDVPEELKPVFSLDMKIPFTGQSLMIWVMYADEASGSMLVLASFGEMFAGQNEEQMWDQIEQSMRQQNPQYGQQFEGAQNWERTTKEIEVRGKSVPFEFAVGRDEDGQLTRIQVTGVFPRDEGPVMFSFQGDAEKYDEETVVKIIESIR